jgi:hypothetical protein
MNGNVKAKVKKRNIEASVVEANISPEETAGWQPLASGIEIDS